MPPSFFNCALQEEANASIRQLQVAGRAGFLDSDDDSDDDDDDYPEFIPEGTGGGGGGALETVAEETEDVASTAGATLSFALDHGPPSLTGSFGGRLVSHLIQ